MYGAKSQGGFCNTMPSVYVAVPIDYARPSRWIM